MTAAADAVISGEMEPTTLLKGGDAVHRSRLVPPFTKRTAVENM